MEWISLEGKILLVVNFIDCAISSCSFYLGLAIERNPVMRFLLERNLLSFIAFKIVLTVFLVSFLEFLRYKRSKDIKIIKILQWTAILILPALFLLANLFF